MKAAVLVFPASNCDRDAKTALEGLGFDVTMVWHKDASLPKVDLVVLPGGFSYGDYLRCGAMAAHSSIAKELKAHAAAGRYVLGICNGFQILTELRLLPGALLKNTGLHFVCDDVYIRATNTSSAFTKGYAKNPVAHIPIAHHDGCYFADRDTLRDLQDHELIAFQYCNEAGEVRPSANPNGSVENIAGILNKTNNVLGMMPHPERACDRLTAGLDGAFLFNSLLGKVA